MSPDPLVYLDHAATTPLDPRVLEAMLPFLREDFGNASSRQHALGRRAAAAVAHAREQVAQLIGADPRELVFTSGATEADNLALKGVAAAPAYERLPRVFVSAPTEHRAVLDPLRRLEQSAGFELRWLAVDELGRLRPGEVERALEEPARLLSLMHANNEIGLVHPLAEIGALCREREVLFHTDATQSAGKVPIDVDALKVDLLSLSAHKFHGPKGVGALYLRRRRPRVRCLPLLDGGGHEGGLRSGSANVPGIVGMGAAAELCRLELEQEGRRVAALRDAFEQRLLREVDEVVRNGAEHPRLPGLTNLSFARTEAESLLRRLEGLAASSSSACTSASLQASHVLRALGLSSARIDASLRFSLGRFTSEAELERAFHELSRAVETERREGPTSACPLD